MALSLVDNSKNVLQFQSKNSKETLEMVKRLLQMAESGQLVGIAGVYFTMDRENGSFAAGEACQRTSDTNYALANLQLKLKGNNELA